MKAEEIVLSKYFRRDYEMYLMGQKRQIDIAKERGLSIHQTVKAFNILLQEKIDQHKNKTQQP